MFEALTEAIKAFAPYPLVQGSFIILIVFIGVWVMKKGERDRRGGGTNGNGMPQWLLYGPVNDIISDVRDIAEQGRSTNEILRRMAENGSRLVESNSTREREQREQTQLLEDIRNNQISRSDVTAAHPTGPRRKPGP